MNKLIENKNETWLIDTEMFYENEDFYCHITDELKGLVKIPLGIYFKISDIYDGTGEYEEHPYVIYADIMVCNPDKRFNDVNDIWKLDNIEQRICDISMCNNYMGGICILNALYTTGIEIDGKLIDIFTEMNGKIHISDEGYYMFKTIEDCYKCIELMIKRIPAFYLYIGYILDEKRNKYTNSNGWDNIKYQLNKDYKYER
jgi:hypothetical protein